LMQEDGIGRRTNIGTIALNNTLDFDLAGVPLFSPHPGVQIGNITRSWWDAEDYLRIEGEIRDSQEARYWLTRKHYMGGSRQWRECGLCPFLLIPTDTAPGVHSLSVTIERVNITLPTHSGFAESWVRFADPTVKYIPPTVEPGKVCAAPVFMGRGF
jgi:hypothetical protein